MRKISLNLREVKLPDDENALYEMYMSKDVIPFMNFEHQLLEEFKSQTLPSMLSNDSKLYVLEVDGKIVAARKMQIGKGPYKHVAYLGGLVVHPNHRRKGYANQLLLKLQDLMGKEIKRIELSQEADNTPAYSLAKKQKFIYEYTMTDWLIRRTGTHQHKWHVAERFLAHFPDERVQPSNSVKIPSGKINFDAMRYADQAISSKEYQIKFNSDSSEIILVNKEGNLVAKANISTGSERYNHIAFLANLELASKIPEKNALLIVMLTLGVLKKFKRIELLVPSSKEDLINTLLAAGFCFQGQRYLAYRNKESNKLENEYAFSISAFNLEDARSALKKVGKVETDVEVARLNLKEVEVDSNLKSILLENYLYQQIMIRHKFYPEGEINMDYLNSLSSEFPKEFKPSP